MPILYVHGVAVREANDLGWPEVRPFIESVNWPGIQVHLRRHVAPTLNALDPDSVVIREVYWGNLAAVPLHAAQGKPSPAPAQQQAPELAEELEQYIRNEMPLQAWPEVIETVWAIAHDDALRQEWQHLPPEQQWHRLQRATASELYRRWHATHPQQLWPWFEQFRQVFRQRLLPRVQHIRGSLESFLPYFMGDILIYLKDRGTPQQPGQIPLRVLEHLTQLHHIKKDTGEPLIILTHSMGGQLIYDALTAYAPLRPELHDLEVDFWCASASQLALFTSLNLFVMPTSPQGTLPRPENVRYLWNIWSPTDLLSFQASPTITGAQDAAVTLTEDALKAHGAYLNHPAFYQALAAKVKTRGMTGR